MRRIGRFTEPALPSPSSSGLVQEIGAILARHAASKWEMADGYTDAARYLPARDGQVLRAIPDSGSGAASEHAMEMLNWVVPGSAAASPICPPVMRSLNGRKCSDHSARNTWGFWCKRSAPQDSARPQARNRMPYNLHDAHFALVALSVPGIGHSGVAFQASKAQEHHTAEVGLYNNRPQACWIDADGQRVVLTSSLTLGPNRPAVITMSSQAGHQCLRVNGAQVAWASASFAPSNFAQLLIGWGFRNYFPNPGFGGHIYGVITGRGVLDEDECETLEHYLGQTAGLTL